MSLTLEICVDTAAGLETALAAGADRIELCAALALGGLTPSGGFMRLAAESGRPVRAMIRPRQGDFTYSAAEIELMRRDIDLARDAGLEGVVIGANRPDGELDEAALAALAGHARTAGLRTTLHRAFDMVAAPVGALETAIGLGFDTVLTSGGAPSALKGVDIVQALVETAAGRIEIMAGSGVNAETVAELVHLSGVRSVHASCGAPRPAVPGKALDLGFVTPIQRHTDGAAVTALRHVLNRIQSTL